MTQTVFAFVQPAPGLRVRVTTQPADDAGAVLCHGEFATPFGTVVALGAGGALWGRSARPPSAIFWEIFLICLRQAAMIRVAPIA